MIRGRERDRRQEIRGQVERGGARSAQRYDPLRLGDQNSKKSIDLELAPLQRLAKASDAGMGLCRPEPLLALYGALSTIIGAVDGHRRDQVHGSDSSRVLAFGTTVMRGTNVTNQIPTRPTKTNAYQRDQQQANSRPTEYQR